MRLCVSYRFHLIDYTEVFPGSIYILRYIDINYIENSAFMILELKATIIDVVNDHLSPDTCTVSNNYQMKNHCNI